ncbi:hypothetical protein [Pectobacterium sp. A5351]|uniref:hypothetical protein n=1 Tax=Pectobacterium sp. A5351 TaxID=2914983 RepID=UPI0023312AC5|nr:hypothetical protein [Pectobacterium sp. A5351]WCG83590.1 hypothetical protein O1Q74_02470 [Pectobacterium sp. A5351]
MGLYVHSLNNIPKSENRDYLIYLLDYGWNEPLAKAINENFDKMASIAAKNRAIVIKGTELAHFENEVFSWHQINNEKGDNILPAILITNAHPSYFKENNYGYNKNKGLYKESNSGDLKLVLIPIKKFCTNTTEVISLIGRIFSDIESEKDLSDFTIAKEIKKGVGSAIVDSIILEPNISGVGFSFKKLITYFRER